MGTVTIELPSQKERTAVNLRRWAEMLADPDLGRFPGRVEMDRHGHAIMNPPPAARHGRFQSRIAHLLRVQMTDGEVLTECPISVADGVRAADVAWASTETMRALGDAVCFPRAPEVCVEILSPSNTDAEIREKTALYFDAGAKEVWLCADSGEMTFLRVGGETGGAPASTTFPDFPRRVILS